MVSGQLHPAHRDVQPSSWETDVRRGSANPSRKASRRAQWHIAQVSASMISHGFNALLRWGLQRGDSGSECCWWSLLDPRVCAMCLCAGGTQMVLHSNK
jgi:hypothetical protein